MADIPKYKNIDFKITEINEFPDKSFRVHFKTKYGKKSILFKEDAQFLHLTTNKPKFLHKIKEFVEKKYSKLNVTECSSDLKEYVNVDMKSEDIEDKSVEYLAAKVIQDRESQFEERKNKMIANQEKLSEMLTLIKDKRELQKEINKEQKMLKSTKNLAKEKKLGCDDCVVP